MKLLSEIGTIIVAIISGFWLYTQPGFESLIAFLLMMGAIVVQAHKRFQRRDVSTLLGKALSPIMRWVDRHRAIASISYDTLSDSIAIHHEVRVWAIWD